MHREPSIVFHLGGSITRQELLDWLLHKEEGRKGEGGGGGRRRKEGEGGINNTEYLKLTVSEELITPWTTRFFQTSLGL